MPTAQDLFKRAEKAEAEGKHLDAATLYERAGDSDRAIASYRKAGQVDRAALLLDQTGRGKEGAALLMSVGQFEKAAQLYEKLKDYPKSAAALLRVNQRERAAAMYEKAELFEDAAKIFASLGNHRKAIQLYEAAGNTEKVAELAAKNVEPAAAQAAQGVLALDPNLDVASAQYMDAAHLVESIVALLRAGRAQDAARLYGSCQEDIGYNVIGAVAGDRAVEMKAAEMLYHAKDFGKAGQILENLEDYARAGKMYELGDDAYMAGEMYVRAGDMAHAAEMFERHGDHQHAAEFYLQVKNYDKAAENFEKSVNNFVAGKLYFRMNKMNKSLQLLQKVQRSEGEYFEAARLIGEILAANGYLDLAIRKYLEVVQTSEVSAKTAPIFYNLGKSLEQRGNLPQALAAYQKILAFEFGYEDVAARVKAVQARLDQPAAAAPEAEPEVLLGGEALPEEAPQAGKVVSMMDGFEFLKGTPLFRDLSLDEMKAVYHACETRKFAAGEILIEQNRPGTALYVIRKGTAKVVKLGPPEEVVAKMGPGSPAGEMALIDDAPTSARVQAETEVEAFCIERVQFEKLLQLNERIALKLFRFFVQTLAKRLRTTSEDLARAAAG